MLNFYDPNMMNITIWHKIYCLYPYSIWEFSPRKENFLYMYPQYPSVSDPFSSLGGDVKMAKSDPEAQRKSSLSDCTWLEKWVLIFQSSNLEIPNAL
jgi:hypothetical protein